MKKNLLTSIVLSTLFYTTLLSTMFVMPLVLAARYDARVPTPIRDSGVWERSLDAPADGQRNRDFRLPHDDDPASPTGPAARKYPPTDQSGPDAAMIKPGKARARTIKA